MTSLSPVEQLEQRFGVQWPNLRTARKAALQARTGLSRAAASLEREDASFVVFGSLARDEFTSGSDIDWTLLVDGSVDPGHFDHAIRLQQVVTDRENKPVGREGLFGSVAFSHELVHQIGGQDDTNRTTTRRLLLLLESRAIGRSDAYDRVIRSILSRYLREDRGFWKGTPFRVPRFLQNDFARYWRTMAVDFAYKLRSRGGEGWAIRNIKLRMSRKLLYAAALLACFRPHFDFNAQQWRDLEKAPDRLQIAIDYFRAQFTRTPLEILAGAPLSPQDEGLKAELFEAYDGFLSILADDKTRDHLKNLGEGEEESDEIYQQAREQTRRFNSGLIKLMFSARLGELTRNYGVF